MISAGTKVRRRRFSNSSQDDQVGVVREVNRKWETALVYWPDKDREFWHSIDDVEPVYEG